MTLPFGFMNGPARVRGGIGDAAFRFLLAVFAGAIKREAKRCPSEC